MAQIVDFAKVSTDGVDSSPVAAALAGLRANEARYFANKYNVDFAVDSAAANPGLLAYVHHILTKERGLSIESAPLQVARVQADSLVFTYVFYQSGLAINVMYHLEDPKKRAVGFKLSDGMEVPAELAARFKFATQKSKLAGTIRGSFFVVKGEYPLEIPGG